MAQNSQDSGLIRRRLIISGRVQGVWFRDSCSKQAQENAVCGWVRNTSDGGVEAVFEGEPEAVERLIEWSKTGPTHAVVESVEVEIEEHEGLSAFSIR